MIDWFSPPGGAIQHLRGLIDQVNQAAQNRFGIGVADISESILLQEYSKNPNKIKALFQIMGGRRSPDMLLMAWRLIQGQEIKQFEILYQYQNKFKIRVVIGSEDAQVNEVYETTRIQDFSIFRHIGILEVDGKPVFEGFYPLRV